MSVTEKSEAEGVYILVERYDIKITLETDSRNCKARCQNDFAGRKPVAFPKREPGPPSGAVSRVCIAQVELRQL